MQDCLNTAAFLALVMGGLFTFVALGLIFTDANIGGEMGMLYGGLISVGIGFAYIMLRYLILRRIKK